MDVATIATTGDEDERMLLRIGYKQVALPHLILIKCTYGLRRAGQELRREFTRWSTVSYAISILGVLGSVPATFNIPVASGGPATAVWCWFFGSCMAMCIAASGSFPPSLSSPFHPLSP